MRAKSRSGRHNLLSQYWRGENPPGRQLLQYPSLGQRLSLKCRVVLRGHLSKLKRVLPQQLQHRMSVVGKLQGPARVSNNMPII